MEREDLKIRLEDVPPEGLDLNIQDKGALLADVAKVADQIKAQIHLARIGPNVRVRGWVDTSLIVNCDRCLEPFTYEIKETLELIIMPPPSGGAEEVRLRKEDLDVSFFDGEVVDVGLVLREQILLALPMRNICRETCQGLCPVCGTNLNERQCQCEREIRHSPFAVLKKLKVSS
ncbi:YceD family protein [Thermosulfuriphilus sp.]